MSVAKVSEISSTSTKSFEDAIQQGLSRASKTLRNIRGAWIKAFAGELIRFPKGKHDDQVDAVSIAIHMMAGMPDRKMYKF